MKSILVTLFLGVGLIACTSAQQNQEKSSNMSKPEIQKSDEEWKKELSTEQYHVLRESGTERPGTGEYNLHFENGKYHCAGCGNELFDSESKFESHCGWPSFDKAISKNTVKEVIDRSHGMTRVEIRCAKCDGHLGHVFNDGPTETGVRYCINSAALGFEKDSTEQE